METGKEVVKINLTNIIPNRFQPRISFDEEALNELANSIKMYGILQPLILRPLGDKYEIIAGERRYKAATIAGLTEVPAILVNLDDQTSAELAIIENIQRKDLTAIEEAKSYKKLIDLGNYTQDQLATKMGKTQSTIANKLRLLNLIPEAQQALMNNSISERHARSLLQLKDNPDKQKEILNRIINERLTVRDTDNAIKLVIGGTLMNENLQPNNEIIEQNKSQPMTNIPNNEATNSISDQINTVSQTQQNLQPSFEIPNMTLPNIGPSNNEIYNNQNEIKQPDLPNIEYNNMMNNNQQNLESQNNNFEHPGFEIPNMNIPSPEINNIDFSNNVPGLNETQNNNEQNINQPTNNFEQPSFEIPNLNTDTFSLSELSNPNLNIPSAPTQNISELPSEEFNKVNITNQNENQNINPPQEDFSEPNYDSLLQEEEKPIEEPKEEIPQPQFAPATPPTDVYFPPLDKEPADMSFANPYETPNFQNNKQEETINIATNQIKDVVTKLGTSGYKITTEEMDLEDSYQLTIKIMKTKDI